MKTTLTIGMLVGMVLLYRYYQKAQAAIKLHQSNNSQLDGMGSLITKMATLLA